MTGAASGQGAEAARLFASHGARVVLTDINPDGAARAAEIGPDNAVFIQHDVSDAQAWSEVVARTLAEFGRIDILVNNAGICHSTAIEDTTDAIYDAVTAVNQRGCFLGMRAVVGPMKAAGGWSV